MTSRKPSRRFLRRQHGRLLHRRHRIPIAKRRLHKMLRRILCTMQIRRMSRILSLQNIVRSKHLRRSRKQSSTAHKLRTPAVRMDSRRAASVRLLRRGPQWLANPGKQSRIRRYILRLSYSLRMTEKRFIMCRAKQLTSLLPSCRMYRRSVPTRIYGHLHLHRRLFFR